MYEDNAPALLADLAKKHVMVEINLSSNDRILGVEGRIPSRSIGRLMSRWRYPQTTRASAASTSPGSMCALRWTTGSTRRISSNWCVPGWNMIFLPGQPVGSTGFVWRLGGRLRRDSRWALPRPSTPCKEFLDSSEKAQAQWELERRFREFEARF